MYRPPILGFDDWRANPSVHVQWKDGTPVASVGILGKFDSETIATEKAERERKEELRQQTNVVLLEDWRHDD
jgi:hypothetical protein